MSTSTTYDYKYTDRDVREDPRLVDLACAYLKTYGGDFEPLVEAKTYLRVVGTPPTAMIRKTLNCMRHDNSVAGQMPVPYRPSFEVEDVVTPPPYRVLHYRGLKATKPESAPRYPFDLRVRWKKRIIAATTKNATAYHYLSPEGSVIRYWPMTGEYKARPKTYCSQELRTGILLDEPPAGRHQCRQCMLMIHEQALRENLRMIEEALLRGE